MKAHDGAADLLEFAHIPIKEIDRYFYIRNFLYILYHHLFAKYKQTLGNHPSTHR